MTAVSKPRDYLFNVQKYENNPPRMAVNIHVNDLFRTVSISEFKEFITDGNVMELAIAVIIGAAFTKIVDSLVADIIMPIIALLGGFDNIDKLTYGPFTYGKLIAATLNFLLVAFVLFMIIKIMNKTKVKVTEKGK